MEGLEQLHIIKAPEYQELFWVGRGWGSEQPKKESIRWHTGDAKDVFF